MAEEHLSLPFCVSLLVSVDRKEGKKERDEAKKILFAHSVNKDSFISKVKRKARDMDHLKCSANCEAIVLSDQCVRVSLGLCVEVWLLSRVLLLLG